MQYQIIENTEIAPGVFLMDLAGDTDPEHYEKGYPLVIPEEIREKIFVAGAALKDGVLVTNGGRVVGCTAVSATLESAVHDAYELASRVEFDNAYCRKDIGQRALAAQKEA